MANHCGPARGPTAACTTTCCRRDARSSWHILQFREDNTMHQRILCGIGTVLTVALLTFSMPDSEASAGWRHRRNGCGGGHSRLLGRQRGWGGGCHGGGNYGGGGCQGGGHYGGGGGGCYAEPVYGGCDQGMQGCNEGSYPVMEPSCGAPHYQDPGMYSAPMGPSQGGSGQAPMPPNAPGGNAPNVAPPDAASGNAPAGSPPPVSPSDSGA